MNESYQNQPSEVDRIMNEAAQRLARQRLTEISRDVEKEKGLEVMIDSLEHGGDDFSLEDVTNFKRGRKDLIEPPRAMYIEGYLKEIERVSKKLNHALQQRCAELLSQFPYRLR